MSERPGTRSPVPGWRLAVVGLLLGLAIVSLYLPVQELELCGDDFLLVQLAHRAAHQPSLLLAPLGSFLRPLTTWTLVADRWLWGSWAGGFHLTNVTLRVVTAALVLLVAWRLGLGLGWALAIAALWSCSPYSAEPVYGVGARIDELLILSWLAVVLAWPPSGHSWSWPRGAAATGALLLALASKETWIVTPGLVAVLEWSRSLSEKPTKASSGLAPHGKEAEQDARKRSQSYALEQLAKGDAARRMPARCAAGAFLRPAPWLGRVLRAMRLVIPVAAVVLVYLAVHVAFIPGEPDYFEVSVRPLARFPNQMAAFFGIEPLAPSPTGVSALGWAGLAAVVTIALLALRVAPGPTLLGLAFLVLPQLPTLFVPFQPTRYTSIPFLGFLLLVVGGAHGLATRLRPVRARALKGVLIVLGGFVWISGALAVRGDLEDLLPVSNAHARLVDEARRLAPHLPVGEPILFIRGERENLLVTAANAASGTPKFYYVRAQDPYGMVDTAALIEWALDREDLAVEAWEDWPTSAAGRAGTGVTHLRSGFVKHPDALADVGATAARLHRQQVGVRVVIIKPLG